MTDYKRRAVILVNLYPKKGDELGKIRPAIIMSDDVDNSELDTLIVLPLSTHLIDSKKQESLDFMRLSNTTLEKIWDNKEDSVYDKFLK